MSLKIIAPAVSTSAGKKAKVFISYSRKDLIFAQELAAALVERGFDAFLDKTDIAPGEPWKERLAGLIAAADTVVFAISPDSVASPICTWELEESARLGKRLIPIVARKIADADAPAPLGRLNWTFCTTDDDKAGALTALDEALHTDLAWVREHTRLGELARRWDEQRRAKGATLRGADLDAAEHWLARRPADVGVPTELHQDFIRASRRAATGRQRSWVAASIAVALSALGLAGFAFLQRNLANAAALEAQKERSEAEAQRQKAIVQKKIAERNFNAAKKTVQNLVFHIAQGLKDTTGMRLETVQTILETAKSSINELLRVSPDNIDLRRIKVVMLSNFARSYSERGDLKQALDAATEAVGIAKDLLALQPGKVEPQRDLALSLDRVGDVKSMARDWAGAMVAYEEALKIAEGIAATAESDADARSDVATAYRAIGFAKINAGDLPGALDAFQHETEGLKKLANENPEHGLTQREFSRSLANIGTVKLRKGDKKGALANYQQALAVFRKLLLKEPESIRAQDDLANILSKVGNAKIGLGDPSGALALYQEAVDVQKVLVDRDKSNADLGRDLSGYLNAVGAAKLKLGDRSGALADYRRALEIRKQLANQQPDYLQAQWEVSLSLDKVGDIALQLGNKKEALGDYKQALSFQKRVALLERNPSDAQLQIVMCLHKIGDLDLDLGEPMEALVAYQESLEVQKQRSVEDTASAQGNFVVIYKKIARAKAQIGDHVGALADYRMAFNTLRTMAATSGDKELPWDMVAILAEAAPLSPRPKDYYREALIIVQSLDKRELAPSARAEVLNWLKNKNANSE